MSSILRASSFAYVLCLSAVFSGASAHGGSEGLQPAQLASQLDGIAASVMEKARYPGVALLLSRRGEVIYRKGFGFADLENRIPVTPDTVFPIGSVTKSFTGLAVMLLVEQGKLSLDAPLSRYLSGFPRGDSITIDMLRVHRAGIPNMNSIPFDEEASEPNTLDSLVRVIAKTPLDFSPGSRRRYSNGGYAVLAAVIEKVTGQSYAEALAERVLRPLGLTHTYEEADGMLVPNRAYGYTASRSQRRGLELAPFQQMTTKSGGGSLVSTAGDLHRLLRAMYTDRPIKKETWRTLFPPDSVFSYQGRCPGYNVFMGRDFTHDVVVVVLCNDYAAGMVGDVGSDLIAMASSPDPVFRRRLAQAEADVEVAKLMGYEAASLLDSGRIPSIEVSVEKIFTSELRQRIADLAIDLLGPDGLRVGNFFERLYRVSPLMRFGGGTNEVLRDVIAQRGHTMPSYGR